jgi:Beta propeller domain
MGQNQSAVQDDKNPEKASEGDEEYGPEILTISPLPSNSKAQDSGDDQKPMEESNSSMWSRRRVILLFLLTLLAVIIVSVTAPLLYKSLKNEKPDRGADINYGPTHTRPTNEDQDDRGDEGNISTLSSEQESLSFTNYLPGLPFEDVKLPYFTEDVMRGYSNRTEFEEALTEAAKFLINKIVLQNLGYIKPSVVENLNSNGFTWRGSNEGEEPKDLYDVTDIETNNQEMGIDESDMMKADSNYVYAAYGNYVLVWDKQGNQVAQAKIPTASEGEQATSQGSIFGSGMFSGSSFGTFSGHTAHVESLLLVDDQLIVVVSGFGDQEESGDQTVLLNYLGTQIRTYKTSSIATAGELTLVGIKDINGRFVDARSIGNQVHIATISGIDTHTYLTAPLSRYVYLPGLTDEEYVEQVRSQALDRYIPAFVEKLSNELLYTDQDGNRVLPNLLQLNQWQTSDGGANTKNVRAIVDAGMFRSGLMNSVTMITSLDVTHPTRGNNELVTSVSAFLAPSQISHLYGTASNLLLATRAWDWNSELKATEEVTHLIVLNTNNRDASSGIVTTFESLGTVRGYILNPYSLSILNDKVRVATAISRRWRFQGVATLSSNSINVGDHYSDKVVVTDRSAGQSDECVMEESTTENYITVLDLNSGSMLEERGSVRLGERDELIVSVRFFDDIAYCITFQQTDPFYVVDLENMNVMGSFKQNGFSNYLHPMNEDKTLLLGIGQNATEEGVETGFMITVFDVADPTNPQARTSYTVNDKSTGSNGAAMHSAAQWDYKSFRYVDGKLIVPLDIVTYSTEGSTADAVRQTVIGSFQGFVVFNVDEDSISEYTRISHVSLGCHYCGYLAPRSFVYNGNVLTAQDNIVSSTNLNTKQEQWAFHIAVDGEERRCCY